MKFLHTSDLHLGLRLCETRLNDDIAHILREITEIACREKCQAVVIAGDIYDKSNPTPDSVSIFDDFVTALAGHGITVLAVAGNHDSPERVAYLSAVLERSGVHFSPVYDGNLHTVKLTDEFGDIYFHLLPFLRPSVVRLTCPDFDGSSADDAVRFALRGIRTDDGARHVVTAHQFVGTISSADETKTSDHIVGGSELVQADAFAGFDYTALGHLHSPHPVSAGAKNIRYSGSPIKCSFSEAADEKSVTLVTLSEKGCVAIDEIGLHPLHDLREMRGSYEEMTSLQARESGRTDDYLRITLTDEEDIPDVMAKLRCIYPNLMRLSYDNRRTRESRMIADDIMTDDGTPALTPESVFAELFELQNNAEADEKTMEIVTGLFRRIERGDESI